MRKINVILLHSLCLMFIVAEAQAIEPTIPYLHVDGNLRTYFFRRDNTKPNVPDQKAFSFGGKRNALTEDCFYGFRLGATALVNRL